MPKLYGTGKKKVMKHLKDPNLSLSSLGDIAASLANVYAKSIKLISSYYGIKNTITYLKYDSQSGENQPETS